MGGRPIAANPHASGGGSRGRDRKRGGPGRVRPRRPTGLGREPPACIGRQNTPQTHHGTHFLARDARGHRARPDAEGLADGPRLGATPLALHVLAPLGARVRAGAGQPQHARARPMPGSGAQPRRVPRPGVLPHRRAGDPRRVARAGTRDRPRPFAHKRMVVGQRRAAVDRGRPRGANHDQRHPPGHLLRRRASVPIHHRGVGRRPRLSASGRYDRQHRGRARKGHAPPVRPRARQVHPRHHHRQHSEPLGPRGRDRSVRGRPRSGQARPSQGPVHARRGQRLRCAATGRQGRGRPEVLRQAVLGLFVWRVGQRVGDVVQLATQPPHAQGRRVLEGMVLGPQPAPDQGTGIP